MKWIGKRVLCAALTACLCMTGAVGVSAEETKETKIVTDAMDRQVEIPTEIHSLAILPMPWVSVVYALNGSGDIITGMQQVAKNSFETSMLKTLAPELEDTNTAFFADGEFNFEELAKIDPDVMILFVSQSDFIENLEEVQIPSVTLKYADSFDTLHKDFQILGDVLGKPERAQSFIDYQKKDLEYLESKASDVEAADQVRVLQLYNKDLTVYNSGVNNACYAYAGAENVGVRDAGDASSLELNMEQILALDPEVILLSNFDDFVPEDFYNNTIDGQDWSNVTAVKEKRVYKIPQGIYRWDGDAPATETTLFAKWLAKVVHPDIFTEYDLKEDVKDFFTEFFDYELSEEELNTILASDVNAQSVSVLE